MRDKLGGAMVTEQSIRTFLFLEELMHREMETNVENRQVFVIFVHKKEI